MSSRPDTGSHGTSIVERATQRRPPGQDGLGVYTQAELAADVGVTRQTIVAVEAGDYAPSVYLALAIARRLGSTVEQLFEEDLEPGRTGSTSMTEAER